MDEGDLYSPAAIVKFAEENGFLKSDPDNPKERKLEKLRIRIAMGRYSNNKKFPDEGDGYLKIRGQAPVPAWFGWAMESGDRGIVLLLCLSALGGFFRLSE